MVISISMSSNLRRVDLDQVSVNESDVGLLGDLDEAADVALERGRWRC
jgi:hypothetical protein